MGSLKVGLTGGIGCGKTVVTNEFSRLSVPIIDTDLITRELTQPGSHILEKITQYFGKTVLTDDGELNRRKLRSLVFNDATLRAKLEAILHPAVREEVFFRIQRLNTPYCITVVPLMLETGMQQLFDRILVVDCEWQHQIERVTQRDECSEKEVRAIIDTQTSRDQRLVIATEILHNTGDLQSLYQSIKLFHQQYLALSESYNPEDS